MSASGALPRYITAVYIKSKLFGVTLPTKSDSSMQRITGKTTVMSMSEMEVFRRWLFSSLWLVVCYDHLPTGNVDVVLNYMTALLDSFTEVLLYMTWYSSQP